MSEHAAKQPISNELHAVVTRCGCSLQQKASPLWHAKHGRPCPNPRAEENLGVIAAHYRNPLRRLAWKCSRWLRGQRAGTATYHGS